MLIAAMGDSFASGEGNPDVPVEFGDARRFRNLYPLRKENHAGGSAQWTDRLCHRSLYGQHLRAALQIGVENRRAAVTFLDYSCSGATIENGILGPQDYVEREDPAGSITPSPYSQLLSERAIRTLLRELCLEKPDTKKGLLILSRRAIPPCHIDFLFLTVGGNDVGFSNIVAWAALRDSTAADIASFFGATVSAKDFGKAMRDILPGILREACPGPRSEHSPFIRRSDRVFDPTRVVPHRLSRSGHQ